MDARCGNSPMNLVLAAGQVQRVLVEAGSMLVVTEGVLSVRFPFRCLADNLVALEAQLRAEEAHQLQDGGWVDLVALVRVQAMILPPKSSVLWEQVGRYVGRMFAATQSARPENADIGRSGDVAAG